MANAAKKDLASYDVEYGRLKQQMGWNSPEASDVDLSGDRNTERGMEMIVKTTNLIMKNMMIVKAMMVVKTTIRTTKVRSESQRLGLT
jgi:hypothetical protein